MGSLPNHDPPSPEKKAALYNESSFIHERCEIVEAEDIDQKLTADAVEVCVPDWLL